MDIMTIFLQTLKLFLIMGAGYAAYALKVLDDKTIKGISSLVVNIALPMMVITAFQFQVSQEIVQNIIVMAVLSFALHFFSFLAGIVLFKKFPQKAQPIYKTALILSNAAFMGYPIVQTMYGNEGVLYASIYVVFFNVFLWTAVKTLFAGKMNGYKAVLQSVFLNPGMVCTIIGLLLFLFSVKLPPVLLDPMQMLASLTTPLSMLIIGGRLGSADFKGIFKIKSIYYVAALRLVVIPLLVFFALRWLPIHPTVSGVLFAVACMPAAATISMFAEQYNGDAVLASRLIFVTTLLSVATIPLMISLL